MSNSRMKTRAAGTVERREFLRCGAVGGALALTGAGIGSPGSAEELTPQRPDSFPFEEATIADLRAGILSGAQTSRALTEAYLERIEALNHRGPTLRAVIETNPQALAVAEGLDRERGTEAARGPLHGIPILLKDNIDTADRNTTTAGSLALDGSIPPQDATIVRRLRDAGAVLLGKANLSEWANIRSTRSSSGWSARGGQCRNPYALDRNPCGSSSGSAVAVSANLCVAAIGTETDGSIVCPANANGLVGLKPTLGLVSRAGIIPIAHSQDTAGPLCRTVRDAAVVLSVIAGVDARDPATGDNRSRSHADYTRFLDAEGLRGARIGVARKLFGFDPRVDRLVEDALQEMKRQGAVLVDPADIPNLGEYDAGELEVLLFELKADLNAYLASLGARAPVRSLEQIIAFNETHRREEMPYFGQELFLKAQEKGPLTEPAYREALLKNRRLAGPEGIDAVMEQHRLDAVVAPTGGPAFLIDLVTGDHFTGGNSSTPPAVSGYPHLTVPAGLVFGLPIGLSFIGRAWSEPTLLKLAYAFEQATKWRRPPRLLPTADLSV